MRTSDPTRTTFGLLSRKTSQTHLEIQVITHTQVESCSSSNRNRQRPSRRYLRTPLVSHFRSGTWLYRLYRWCHRAKYQPNDCQWCHFWFGWWVSRDVLFVCAGDGSESVPIHNSGYVNPFVAIKTLGLANLMIRHHRVFQFACYVQFPHLIYIHCTFQAWLANVSLVMFCF